MKRTIVLIVACMFCANIAFAGGDAWYTTKWGMTEKQVEKSLGMKIEFVESSKDNIKTYVVKGFDIRSMRFNVRFIFCSGLSGVSLENIDEDKLKSFFFMKDMYTTKYGKPTIDSVEVIDRNSTVKKMMWMTNETKVSLTYLDMFTVQNQIVKSLSVFYQPRNPKSLSKI